MDYSKRLQAGCKHNDAFNNIIRVFSLALISVLGVMSSQWFYGY